MHRRHEGWRDISLFCSRLIPVWLCFIITVALMVGTTHAAEWSVLSEVATRAEAAKAQGRWTRSDGGYVLELSEMKADGSMTALYYNPQPIKVSRAAWNEKDGKTILFVELGDVNYPGSTYYLQYDPLSDRLLGTYFQAVEKITYAIEFGRSK